MAGQYQQSDTARASVFFDKAQKVAEKGNYDYAIDMYLEGLRNAPDATKAGHIKLRELGMKRAEKNGKKPSMMEKVKALKSKKDPLDQMLSAEMLLAKDPMNIDYAESMLKAAIEGQWGQTSLWIADIIFQINMNAKKPSFSTYTLLKDSYSRMELFERAIRACQEAVKIKPENIEIAKELQRLSAEYTVSRGRYDDQDSDFRKAIKDKDAQDKLHSQDSVIKTEDYRIKAIESAKKEYQADPNSSKNIFGLARALADMEEDRYENKAVQILESAYKVKNEFSFQERAGEIRMKTLKRNIRQQKRILESDGDNEKAKANLAKLQKMFSDTKLKHYELCVTNYPTDMGAKYELANCLLQNKQYDDAIPLFQEAQRDMKFKIVAMSKIGTCFFNKKWYSDSIDIFTQAINAYESNDDNVAKELKYNLANAYELDNNNEKALDIYRKIAQIDFGYRDVRKKIDAIRQKTQEN